MGVKIEIIGAGAFLTPDGDTAGRPFMRGDTIMVDKDTADRLIRDGVAAKPGKGSNTGPAGGTVSPAADESGEG